MRPSHLFEGTKSDNNADRDEKGRTMRGERQWLAKVTEDDVRAIRVAAARGVRTVDLGLRYGLHTSNIRAIVRRKTWKHVA